MDEVMQFLKALEAEIERSYAAANARAAAQRRYWEARNRHVLTRDVSQLTLPSHVDTRWLALRDTWLAARGKCEEQPNGMHADPLWEGEDIHGSRPEPFCTTHHAT
jgi:hypothetical protein